MTSLEGLVFRVRGPDRRSLIGLERMAPVADAGVQLGSYCSASIMKRRYSLAAFGYLVCENTMQLTSGARSVGPADGTDRHAGVVDILRHRLDRRVLLNS